MYNAECIMDILRRNETLSYDLETQGNKGNERKGNEQIDFNAERGNDQHIKCIHCE